MASNGLPRGAFLTTLRGRRCTAVPRIQATSAGTNSSNLPVTTDLSYEEGASDPTTALVVAPAADGDSSTAVADPSFVPSSASTTGSSLAITAASTPSVPPSSVQAAQAEESNSEPSSLPPTPLPTALVPTDAPVQTSTAFFADEAPSSLQTSETQDSEVDDGSLTASPSSVASTSSETVPTDSSTSLLPDGPGATRLLTTIEIPQAPSSTNVAEATSTTSTDSAAGALPSSNSNAVQSTVAVAGGVIGGVVAISILAFFIWWWRRRLHRKRRSTLLTPLDAPSSLDRGEKGAYAIARGSIGPTPMAEKVKAALGQNWRKIRRHIRNRTEPSVNLDRGPSQFLDPAGARSRADTPTAKERLQSWWSQFTIGMGCERADETDHFTRAAGTQEKASAPGARPDFLTLVAMDDAAEAQQRQRQRQGHASRMSRGAASASDGSFLGSLDLNLNFGNPPDNPFSDANAVAHPSAQPAPLAVGRHGANRNDPFSDLNAALDLDPPPAAHVPEITATYHNRRNSANSLDDDIDDGDGNGDGENINTAPDDQRNKFRSDPFDLELRPELLRGAATTTAVPQPPAVAAVAGRVESFTSKYSSGASSVSSVNSVSSLSSSRRSRGSGGGGGGGNSGRMGSMGEYWSDPGPDVGPGASASATAAGGWWTTGGNGNNGGDVWDGRRRVSGGGE